MNKFNVTISQNGINNTVYNGIPAKTKLDAMVKCLDSHRTLMNIPRGIILEATAKVMRNA